MSTRIKELREAKGLKSYELAVELGVNPSTVHYWEREGGIPDHRKLVLADYFGVSVDYLMGWDTEKAA